MKPTFKILLSLCFLLSSPLVAIAQDAANSPHWYTFDIENHNAIAATSPLSPEDLARALNGTDYVRLDTVRDFNGAGKWNAASAPFTGTLYVRPQTVRSFEPLTGPPKDFDLKDVK